MTRAEGLRLLEVEGSLATDDRPRLRARLDEAIAAGADAIVVDLRGCGLLAGGCLRALVEASARLTETGGRGVTLVVRDESMLPRSSTAGAQPTLPTFQAAGLAVHSLRAA